MYDDLIVQIRQLQHWFKPNGSDQFNPYEILEQAANAIEELRKAVLRLEDESGIYDELPTFYIYPTKWIPVTERLPKKPKNYPKCEIRRAYFLVALESGCVKSLGYEFDRDEWQITGSPVVAWMPLPEPPKEGKR